MKKIKKIIAVILLIALGISSIHFEAFIEKINAANEFVFTFKDSTDTQWLKGTQDGVVAYYDITSNGTTYPMVMSSNGKSWTAALPNNIGTFTVNRRPENGQGLWNSWDIRGSERDGKTVYEATGDGSGKWTDESTPVDPADTEYDIYGSQSTKLQSFSSKKIKLDQIVDDNDSSNALLVVPAIYYSYTTDRAQSNKTYSESSNWWRQFQPLNQAISKKYYGSDKMRYPLFTQAADTLDTTEDDADLSPNRPLTNMFFNNGYNSNITDGTALLYINHNLSIGLSTVDAPVQGLVAPYLGTNRELLSAEGSNGQNVVMPFFDDNFLGTTGSEKVKTGYWGTRYGTLESPLSFPFRRQGDLYIFESSSGKDNLRVHEDGSVTYSSSENAQVNNTTESIPGFYPFNDHAQSGNSASLKYGFATRMDIPFTVPQSENEIKFNFQGDDDIWVYIDGRLVLDLGGAHGNSEGEINFTNDKVYAKNAYIMNYSSNVVQSTENNKSLSDLFDSEDYFSNPYEEHTMTIFYMERGLYDSNLKISFNFEAKNLIQSNGFKVENEISADHVADALKNAAIVAAEQDVFTYNIVNVDNNRDAEHQIIAGGATLAEHTGSGNVVSKEIKVSGENEEEINQHSIRNNRISVAQKQEEKYDTKFGIADGDGNTIVEKRKVNYISTDSNGTWLKADDDDFRRKPNSQTVLVQNAEATDDPETTITTEVTYYNDIKVSGFTIEKQYDGSARTEFTFEVKYTKLFGHNTVSNTLINGSFNNLIYSVNGEERKVINDQIKLKAGEVAVFTGIPVDTTITVKELYADNTFYSVQVSGSADASDNKTLSENGLTTVTLGTDGTEPSYTYVNKKSVSERWVFYTEVGKQTELPIPDSYLEKGETTSGGSENQGYKITENTVFFQPSSGWDGYTTFYCYVWSAGVTTTGWPGDPMEYDADSGYYVFELPGTTNTQNLIFNCGTGNPQTANLSYTRGTSNRLFILNSSSAGTANWNGSWINYGSISPSEPIPPVVEKYNVWSLNGIEFIQDAYDENHRIDVQWKSGNPEVEDDSHTLTITSTHVGKDIFDIELKNVDETIKIIRVVVYNYNVNNHVYVLDYGLPVNLSVGNSGLFGTANDDGYNYDKNISVNNQTILDSSDDADVNTLLGFADTKIGEAYESALIYKAEINDFKEAKSFNQATVSLNAKNQAIYTPEKFMTDIDTFYYGVQVTKSGTKASDALDATNATPIMTGNVKVMPANIVYYEDNFSQSGTISKADGKNGIIYSNNATYGTDAGDDQSNDNSEQYGHDSSYEKSGESSQGITHILNNGDTAIFSFKGTGFDISSRTNYATGILQATVYDASKVTIQNGTVKANSFTSIVKTILVNTYYQNGDLYQIPVITWRSGSDEAKEYVVKLSAGGDGKIVYLDGIRIYNPITGNGEAANQAKAEYEKIGENGAIKEEAKSLILGTTDYATNYGELAEGEGDLITALGTPKASLIDYSTNTLTAGKTVVEAFTSYEEAGGTPSAFSDLITYAASGPNHELYLSNNYGIAFVAEQTSDSNATLQVGVKKVAGTGKITLQYMKSNNSWENVAEVSSSTENYYRLNEQLSGMPTDESGNPKVILRVVGGSDAILSMTYLKYNNFNISPLSEGINTEVDSKKIEISGENFGGSYNHQKQEYAAGVMGTITVTISSDAYDVKVIHNGKELPAIKRSVKVDNGYQWTLKFKTTTIVKLADLEVYSCTLK